MALSANTIRQYDIEAPGKINAVGVLANAQIWKGSAVGSSGGYGRALVAADMFLGFAEQDILGTATSGQYTVSIITRGRVTTPVTGASVTSIGASVYMSDDNTFTLTSTSNSLVGIVWRWESGTTCVVEFGLNGTV